jgi:hypothetical protein
MSVAAVTWSWLAPAALGAGHGLNPGMGWLFAVALGMQEGRASAVWRALTPLALGHAFAVGAVVLAASAVGRFVPPEVLGWIVGGSLLGLGATRLFRHRHPRYGGMRVGFHELTTWSFLMATAHGAGLMVLPLLLGREGAGVGGGHLGGHAMHLSSASALPLVPSGDAVGLAVWATAAHSAGYLLVTGLIAVIVYHKLGLRMLRTMWINLDLIWGAVLVVTGIVAVV